METLPGNRERERKSARKQAIPRRNSYEACPLSFPQQRFWFLNQLDLDSPAYNQPNAIRFRGILKIEALKKALDAIVERHETLRTTFPSKDGHPVQLVGQFRPIELPVVDLSGVLSDKREAEIERIILEITHQPFDLCRDLMLRVALLKLDLAEHVLLLVTHDIASDGWSSRVLFREIAALYEAFSDNRSSPLPDLPIQYADFAVWQRQRLQGELLESQIAYWRRQLGTNVPILRLPTDRPGPIVRSYRGASETVALPKSLSDNLKEFSRRNRVTLFMTLLAAFQVLLHRYTGQEDIPVGVPIANRTHVEMEGLIGVFTNTLVLKTNLSGNPTFQELLQRVRQVAVGAFEHQDLPFEKLVEELNPERNLARTPLFQVVFNLRNFPKHEVLLPGLTLSVVPVHRRTAKFDLTLFMTDREPGLIGMMEYLTDLFDSSTITRMIGHFATILGGIVAQPDTRLNALQMVPEPQRSQQAVNEKERKTSKIESLRTAKRKAIDLSQVDLTRTEYLGPGETLPLVMQPVLDDVDIVGWAKNNTHFIESPLLKHGAILFRGFNVTSVSEFEKFAMAICPELFSEYEDLPREAQGSKIYQSTPYPSDQSILFHNESSHMNRWPLKQWFFCLEAARQGGETPIFDGRKVYRLIPADIVKRFENKGIMYVRNFTDNFDVKWQDYFRTNERSAVEEYCKTAFMDWEWKQNGSLRIRHVGPAVVAHPKTGERSWFNQVQHWHPACLPPETRASLGSIFDERDLPRNCYYGDGAKIEDAVVEEICRICRAAAVSFAWQPGDILMIDNMLTAHARNPFVGSRKIVVALGEMIDQEGIQSR